MSRHAPTTIPERIAPLLGVVRVLLGYGRHLAGTVRNRAAAPGFTTIAACFGTIDLSVILAHLHRGILRALALQHVLLARAASGHVVSKTRLRHVVSKTRLRHDIDFTGAHIPARDARPAPAQNAAGQQPAAPAARKAALRPPRRSPWDDVAGFHTPTLAQLTAQVRRRPLGRTIVDICLDLAVVPGICTGPFWNELFEVIQGYGGSIAALMLERCRREDAFSREQDRHPTHSWNPSDRRREMARLVLGFFVGEEPVIPFSPSAALAPALPAATRPP